MTFDDAQAGFGEPDFQSGTSGQGWDDPLDDLDGVVLAALAAMHTRQDPVPPNLAEDAKFAIAVKLMHAEVAEIRRQAQDVAAVRSTDFNRVETLTFTSDTVTVMITVTSRDAESVRVDGWVDGPPILVEVRDRTGSHVVEAGDDGRFSVPRVARGLAQLVFRERDGSARPVVTPHFEL